MNANSVRASLRLARFAGLTSFHSLEAVGGNATGKLGPAEAAGIISAWANRLIGTFGLSVHRRGVAPSRPALLVANHRSYVDIALIAAHVRTLFLAKAEIENWPMLGVGARASGCVFVQREDPASRADARRDLQSILKQGTSVVVFPEGTTARGPGLGSFHPGSFRAAHEAGVPVVPISLFYPNRDLAYIDDETFIPHFLSRFGDEVIDAYIAFGPAMTSPDPLMARDACHGWIASELARQEAFAPEHATVRLPVPVGTAERRTAALGATG